ERNMLLTIHQRDHAVISRLRDRIAAAPIEDDDVPQLVDDVVLHAIETFAGPLDSLTADLVEFESTLLHSRTTERTLEKVFIRKRRASALSWMLVRMREALARVHSTHEGAYAFRESRDALDALHYRAREVTEHTDNLLNLQIAVASHRTNEVMRLLTVM